MSSPDLILITRPEPGASDTAARIAAMGLSPVIAPCLEVRAVPTSLPVPGTAAAILMASGNAAAAFPPAWHATPVLAVGDATARRARDAGFRDAISAGGDAVALAALARARLRPAGGPLLLAAGEGQSQPLATALREAGFRVIRRVVYAARPAKTLPAQARDALESGRTRAVLFFSTETARQFMRLVSRAGLRPSLRSCDAITIGPRVAVALEGAGWARIRVASGPNQADMLSMLR
jgi:uroporphyrinogen-III synthase